MGGLLLAFPIWTILTYIFLSMSSKTTSHHEYLVSALVFMLPAAIFIISLLLLKSTNLWLSLAAGMVFYLIVAFLINKWLMGN
jgi:hypothetical protein